MCFFWTQNNEPTAHSIWEKYLDDLAQVLAEESTARGRIKSGTTEQPVNPQATVDDQQSELYDEGFVTQVRRPEQLEEQRWSRRLEIHLRKL